MASPPALLLLLVLSFSLLAFRSSAYDPRKLFLVQQPPMALDYHRGPLLKGGLTLHLLWYGRFSPAQRSVVADFVRSLSPRQGPPPPSAASWWSTTALYSPAAGPTRISLGKQLLDERYSLGKSLTDANLSALASRGPHRSALTVVLTAPDVTVDGFCMDRCGAHGSARAGRHGGARFAFVWVGDSAAQCPGFCAWPFHQPLVGPQTPPLVPPSGDVGVDGIIINLASLLAGAVTNPFGNGYFQGPAEAPLEAATACTGMFGPGSFPGYPGNLMVDPTTGASFNVRGLDGRKFLLPAMWDPKTSQCTTLV